jgi:hypothetical protein
METNPGINSIACSLVRAKKLLRAYQQQTNQNGSEFSNIRDMITDLLHYTEENKLGLVEDLLEISLQMHLDEQAMEHEEIRLCFWEEKQKQKKV